MKRRVVAHTTIAAYTVSLGQILCRIVQYYFSLCRCAIKAGHLWAPEVDENEGQDKHKSYESARESPLLACCCFPEKQINVSRRSLAGTARLHLSLWDFLIFQFDLDHVGLSAGAATGARPASGSVDGRLHAGEGGRHPPEQLFDVVTCLCGSLDEHDVEFFGFPLACKRNWISVFNASIFRNPISTHRRKMN